MKIDELNTLRINADLLSSIVNWVCPQCGGKMGGRGNEFKCLGKCKIDWRPIWEKSTANTTNQRVSRRRRSFMCQ
jgi:tRNA(Ile2) C34 agmatinyltransferase TiaS